MIDYSSNWSRLFVKLQNITMALSGGTPIINDDYKNVYSSFWINLFTQLDNIISKISGGGGGNVNSVSFNNLAPVSPDNEKNVRLSVTADDIPCGDKSVSSAIDTKAARGIVTGATNLLRNSARQMVIAGGTVKYNNDSSITPVTPARTGKYDYNAFGGVISEDGSFIELTHASEDTLAELATPAAGSDTIVLNGIYIVKLDRTSGEYTVLDTWYDGTNWTRGEGIYKYTFDDTIGSLMNRSTSYQNSNIMRSDNAAFSQKSYEFGILDAVYTRGALSKTPLIPMLQQGDVANYKPVLMFEGDRIEIVSGLPSMGEQVRIYSIDKSFYLRYNGAYPYKVDVVFEDIVLASLENIGDTYMCIGFSAFDFNGIVGSESAVNQLMNSIGLSGPARGATMNEALTAVSDTAIRANKNVQIKPSINYASAWAVVPAQTDCVWRMNSPAWPNLPSGVTTLYVDVWNTGSAIVRVAYTTGGVYYDLTSSGTWTKVTS